MAKNLNADLMSANESLYDDLFIQKLETRLETDPLGVGGLVDLMGGDASNIAMASNGCEGEFTCDGEFSCDWF